MPLSSTFTPAGGTDGGIEKKSIARIICDRLRTTWPVPPTFPDVKTLDVWFDYTQNDLKPENIPQSRFVLIRVFSGRTAHRDMEPGIFTQRFEGRPSIHVFVRDNRATLDGKTSPVLERLASYILGYMSDNVSGFQNEGIHYIEKLESDFIPNTMAPDYHHWYILFNANWEMYRS